MDADPILIPTGDILANQPDSLNDFWTAPKQIGANFSNPDLKGNCGEGCTGYDTCYLTNRQEPYDWRVGTPVARLRSAWSGIQVDVHTDQEAFQIYSCGGQNGACLTFFSLTLTPFQIPFSLRPLPTLNSYTHTRLRSPQDHTGPTQCCQPPARHRAVRLHRHGGRGLD